MSSTPDTRARPSFAYAVKHQERRREAFFARSKQLREEALERARKLTDKQDEAEDDSRNQVRHICLANSEGCACSSWHFHTAYGRLTNGHGTLPGWLVFLLNLVADIPTR
jgi:hypothetical protein